MAETKKTTTKSKTKSSTRTKSNGTTKKTTTRTGTKTTTKSVSTNLSASKVVNKAIKKIPTVIKFVGVILFALGLFTGNLIGKKICENDTFELIDCQTSYDIGSDNIISVEGVKLISFGKDKSDSVYLELSEGLSKTSDGKFVIEDTSKEGVYYIIYRTDDIKFSKVQKIRYIYVSDFSDRRECRKRR